MNETQKPLIVAVDFDGTCVTHEYPRVGRDIGAVPVLRRIVETGGQLILWTMRSGQPLQDAIQWFEHWQIPLFGIQRNPEQEEWTSSPKAYAKLYIDDAAIGCPLVAGLQGERPYVDWWAIESILWPSEIVVENDLSWFQRKVHEWSQATFPHQTPESKFHHLIKEVAELGADLNNGEEMADCLLLLAGLAEMKGINLLSEAIRKLQINQCRNWGPPDAQGVSQHVKEAGQN